MSDNDEISHGHIPSVGFDFEAVEDPIDVCMEDLIRINFNRKGSVVVTRELAALALAWGAEKSLGPSEVILERCGLWIGGSDDPNDMTFRAACFVRVFAPTAKNAMTLRRIAKLCRKGVTMPNGDTSPGFVDTTCRNLKAVLFGGQLWWPSEKQRKARAKREATTQQNEN